MHLYILLPVLALMLLLQWRKVGMLVWLFAYWIGIFVILKYGFTTPIPQSVIVLYMGIITSALVIYVSWDNKRFHAVVDPLVAFMTNRKHTLPLVLVVLLIPSLVATSVYLSRTAPVAAPFFARSVHPANPAAINAFSKDFDLATLDNPLRPLEDDNPQAFAQHLANGRAVYYKNCHYCHGDNMTGNGQYADGLNPIPTNFADSGTIAMLQESYLFWRITKGAPGLPEEGGPWESAMPVWESFLTEEEIWEVVLFLYDFTGQRPRAREEVH
ncbi:MAG: cytochrome c [Acidobacteriota bacterium]